MKCGYFLTPGKFYGSYKSNIYLWKETKEASLPKTERNKGTSFRIMRYI